MQCDPELWKHAPGRKYETIENERFMLWFSGIAAYMQDRACINDAQEIAALFCAGELDFNRLHGFYSLVLFDKREMCHYFWGDNSGSQYFFADMEENCFSDSFLHLLRARKGRLSPCFEGIAQLLSDQHFGTETPVKGIFITDPDNIYRFSAGKVESISKKLLPLNKCEGTELSPLMEALCGAAKESRIGAVCTGGTDSRLVLAHLSRLGQKPPLIITGHKDNPDVALAVKIADTLGLELSIVDPTAKEEGWLEKALEFSDGRYDSVLSYRHLQVMNWAESKNISCLFGGVGGEYYKDSFCFALRYPSLLFSHSPRAVFGKMVEKRMRLPRWASTELISARNSFIESCLAHMGDFEEKGPVRCVFNRMGMQIMRHRCGLITHAFAGRCTRVDPLMDRELVSRQSRFSPLRFLMCHWHRKEIHRACPALSDIPTDQGFSCTVRPTGFTSESARKIIRWAKLVLLHFGLLKKKSTPAYWDNDYDFAKDSVEFHKAFRLCQELGIIAEDFTEKDVASSQVGNIILLGQLFSIGDRQNP